MWSSEERLTKFWCHAGIRFQGMPPVVLDIASLTGVALGFMSTMMGM